MTKPGLPPGNSEKLEAAEEAHRATGHAGRDATYLFLKERRQFPGMYGIVTRVTRECLTCNKFRTKEKFTIGPGELKKPFEKLGLDLIGLLEKTGRGNRYIIMVTDYATKFAIAHLIREKSEVEVARFLVEKVFLRYGVPKEK